MCMNFPKGITIDPLIGRCTSFYTDAKFVLIVEDHATFSKSMKEYYNIYIINFTF